MSKKLLVFGASNSSESINRQLALWAAEQMAQVEVHLVDLNEYEMPIFSIDRERSGGIPERAVQFKRLIEEADGIIISFAEHNSNYTSAYKNVLDWVSRIGGKIWVDTPVFIMATSPGKRGAQKVLEIARGAIPYQGGRLAGVFSLPFFEDNFDPENGIQNEELLADFQRELSLFTEVLYAEELVQRKP